MKTNDSMKTTAKSALKNTTPVESTTFLPHSDPLPLGEGTAIGLSHFFADAPAKPALECFNKLRTVLPLPAGEGWREGEFPNSSSALAPANNAKTFLKRSLIVIAALALAAPVFAGNITVKGSDTMVILAQKWAEVYMAKHADTKIQVTGGGSGTGFAALQNQTTDLCDASRKIKASEIEACIKAFGKRPTEYKVAIDGLSVYVNANNPVKALSVDQLEQIFTGKIKNWKAVGGPDAPVKLYSRENSSGTYEFFKEHVLKGRDFAASAQTMPGTAAVLQAVANDPNGIGYGGAAYGAGAKHLLVKAGESSPAIDPTEENVVGQKYPIWRYLYIYANPALDKGGVAAYLNWIRSDEGQKVVKEVGYFPLPENLRQK